LNNMASLARMSENNSSGQAEGAYFTSYKTTTWSIFDCSPA
jgi:hypothetical protein